MAQGISRSWSTNDLRPLAEKWAEANLQSIAVGAGQLPGPPTEASLDLARREIARRTVPPPWDAALAEGARALSEVAHRYWRAHAAIVDCQTRLARLGETREQAILRNITAETLQPPLEPNRMLDRLFPAPQRRSHPSPHGLCMPELDSVPAYHEAAQAVLARTLDLEATHARLRHVLEYEVMPRDQQNRALILALFDHITELKCLLQESISRINHLEQPARATRSKRR